jgi:hypothetical protein
VYHSSGSILNNGISCATARPEQVSGIAANKAEAIFPAILFVFGVYTISSI